jgi:hypothetical protein
MDDFEQTELVHWRELPPAQRCGWWEHVWQAAIMLATRYRIALRRGWWEDSVQVEAVAAFHAWLRLYDTGAYTDPPGKLQLLWELDRLRSALRAGESAFDPEADRPLFELHLEALDGGAPGPQHGAALLAAQPAAELSAVRERLSELREREALLRAERPIAGRYSGEEREIEQELGRLKEAIADLGARELELLSGEAGRAASAGSC